jgi:hypothetical protein
MLLVDIIKPHVYESGHYGGTTCGVAFKLSLSLCLNIERL